MCPFDLSIDSMLKPTKFNGKSSKPAIGTGFALACRWICFCFAVIYVPQNSIYLDTKYKSCG